jgi:hypothetical protein
MALKRHATVINTRLQRVISHNLQEPSAPLISSPMCSASYAPCYREGEGRFGGDAYLHFGRLLLSVPFSAPDECKLPLQCITFQTLLDAVVRQGLFNGPVYRYETIYTM